MSAAILSGLALASCGGSAHPTATSSGSATTGSGSAPAASTRSQAATTTPPGYSTATGTLPATVTQPPATTHRAKRTPPRASGARIPATFRIGPGDRGTPPAVNAPALIPVQVTLISADGRAHSATLHTTPAHTLDIPAGGRASVLVPGLRNGSYTIVLDHGAGRLTLLIGGQPGP